MRKLPLALIILLPVICDPGFVPDRPVPPLAKTGELVVLTTNSTTTRYIDSLGQYTGLEYELVEMFAAELGVRVRYLDRQPLYQILRSLQNNTAHLAAAGISVTSSRLNEFQFGPSYQMVQQVLAYNTDTPMPRDLKDLAGKQIEVVRGSSAVEQLELLRRRQPRLRWIAISESDSEALLARLSEGKVDYVVTDAHTLDIVRKLYPNLARAFALGEPEPLAWAFPRQGDPYVIARAEEFFLRLIYDGTLRRMLERYYGHVGRLDQLDVAKYLAAIRTVLPDYRALFQEAQELTGIDWRLIAALGFQESHWNPSAVSPTGVRGLMMLTADTADRMRVTNRLDARQSIIAGARYLLEMKEMLPQRVQEPDRTWLALAAYNLGLGHVEDARVLAQRQRLDPNLWVNVKQVLPLLSRYEYYSTAKRGFCRGSEGLALTENIRNYYDILASYEPPHVTGLTPFVQSGRPGDQRPSLTAPPL